MDIKELTKDTVNLPDYPNLYFKTPKEYIDNALAFGKEHVKPKEGYIRTLSDCFASLQRMTQNQDEIVILYQDFVKHSFYFVMYTNKGEKDMNGGVILHGFEETYSVELDPPEGPHWSIHT